MAAGAVPSLSVGWWSVFGGSWVGSNVVGESVIGHFLICRSEKLDEDLFLSFFYMEII